MATRWNPLPWKFDKVLTGAASGGIIRVYGDSGYASPDASGYIYVETPGGGLQGISVVGDSANTLTISVTDTSPNYVLVTGPTGLTPYVVQDDDDYISCDSTLGDIIIHLPNAAPLYKEYVIKDRDGTAAGGGQTITITTPGGAVTIDGLTSYSFTDAYESLRVIYNGANYETF